MTPPGKEQIVLHTSVEFKNALGEYATTHKMPMAEVIRKATAALIGYALENEAPRSRTPKYESKEEQVRVNLHRALLKRWGKDAIVKASLQGDNVAVLILSRAVASNDYEVLDLLRTAAKAAKVDPDDEIEAEAETLRMDEEMINEGE
jgi:hypothetical protein